MRKFFGFGNSKSPDEAPTTSENMNREAKKRESIPKEKSSISPLVLNAATTLSEAIDEILCDTNSLTGENASGFVRLIEILQDTATCTDLVSISNSRGIGCLQVLLDNAHHVHFTETCNQTTLVTGLMHSLRILRMYEIKISKEFIRSSSPKLTDNNSPITTTSSSRGVTFIASERACAVFRRLCSDPSTIEKIRPSLIKVITFPLFPFPRSAIHLQDHSASVLGQMCLAGFNSQQVWFLHDSQVAHQIIRFLSDLTGISNTAGAIPSDLSIPGGSAPAAALNDCLLRGSDAEQCGLWFTAVSCVINFLCASAVTGTILISDFENAGGHRLLTSILDRTSSDRLIMSLNVVIKLLFDRQKKPDDPVAFPNAAGIIYDLLLHSLGIDRGIDIEDGIDKMVGLGHILYESREKVEKSQHVVQNISYCLLTLYSNDPRNCNILEERFHFLPTLVISIPALSSPDSISAVLTALNYVCQCIDTASTLPLLALCAAATVIVFSTLHCDKTSIHEREVATNRLDSVYSSIDAMIRSHSKFAITLVRCGMLEHLICGPIEQLRSNIWHGGSVEEWSLPVYSKLISIIVALNRKNPFVADEIRKCGLQLMIRDLIKSPVISSDFTLELLVLLEDLAQRDTSHLEEAVQSFIDLLRHTRSDYLKMARILNSLSLVILRVEEAAGIWSQVNGFSCLLEVLGSLDNVFVGKKAEGDLNVEAAVVLANAFECVKCAVRCMAADATTNVGMIIYELESDAKLQQFRLNCRRFIRALRNTGIFDEKSPFALPCVEVVFWLISGAAPKPIIVNPHSVVAVVELIPHLSLALAQQALSYLTVFANCRVDSSQQLCKSGLVRMLIESFRDLVSGDKAELRFQIAEFIKQLLSSYLTVDDFTCFLQHFVRIDVTVNCSNGKLLSPWVASDAIIANREWESVKLMEYLAIDDDVCLNGLPFVLLGTKISKIHEQPAYVTAFLSEASSVFPANNFSFSAWVRLHHSLKDNTPEDEMVIPLLALNSFSVGGCFLEAQFDVHRGFVRILVRKGKKITTLRFKPAQALNAFEWHHVLISFKRSKRYPLTSKHSFMTFFNGIQGLAVNTDSVDCDLPQTITSNTSSSIAPVELAIGKNAFELSPLTAESVFGDDVMLKALNPIKLWCLGPCHLFEETITAPQAAFIFIKGPRYTGTFQAEYAHQSTISHLSSTVLRSCVSKDATVEWCVEQLGLKGIEYVVDPKVEPSPVLVLDIVSIPPPLISFSAKNLLTVPLVATSYVKRGEPELMLGSPNQSAMTDRLSMNSNPEMSSKKDKSIEENDVWGSCRISLLNMATCSRERSPEGSLMNGQFCFSSESVASCVAACGGPQILFPILQSASTSEQIISFFRILKSCLSHANNVKYLQTVGYKICAYILSIKPKDIVSTNIIEAIFDIAVERKLDADDIPSCFLLVDTCAFFHLLLNTQVWDFGSSSSAIKILELILILTGDSMNGMLNRKRLSSIGVVKWLIHLLAFGAEQSCKNSASTSEMSPDCWKILISSESVLSEREDDSDSFLKLVINSIEDIVNVEMRQKDLELMLNTILHTLIPQYNQAQFIGNDAYYKASLMDPDIKPVRELSAMCIARVYLLRYLLDLTERCRAAGNINASSKPTKLTAIRVRMVPLSTEGFPVINVLKQALTVEWFLTVQDKIGDCATWTYYLRLLWSMFDCIPGFQTDFCAHDGINLIGKQLLTIPLNVSVLIPLLGMLFKIPEAALPYKLHHSIDMVLLLGNEECMGPVINEPWLSSVTIPVLGLVLSCLTSWQRLNGIFEENGNPDIDAKDLSSIITDVIVEMMKRAHKQNQEFRRLLQFKGSIEILASAMLSCSNAVDEYGSHILANIYDNIGNGKPPTTVDLSLLVKPDYITETGELSIQPIQIEPQPLNGRDTSYDRVVKQLTITGREGQFLVDLINKVLTNAVTEFDHCTTLSSFMISFPRNLVESFATSFHLFLIKQFDGAVTQLLENRREEPHVLHLQSIANTLTSLVPLSRARLIDDAVQIEILLLSIRLLKYLTHVAASKATSLLDKLNIIIKDVGTTCRFFAISCVQAVSVERKNSEDLRLVMLRIVRTNLDTFLMSMISDENADFNGIGSSRFKRLDSGGNDTVDKGAGTAVLEAFQISWNIESSLSSTTTNSASRRIASESTQLGIAQADKIKFSQLFTIANICFCCNLVFDENILIRQEALRLFSLLAIHKKQLIEQLILASASVGRNSLLKMAFDSNSAGEDSYTKASRGAQLFMEGVDKLIPVDINLYLAFLRNEDDDATREEQRFADFSYWFADNASRCSRILQPIESFFQSMSSGGADVDDMVRQIQTYRAKEDMKSESAKSVLILMKRAEEGQRLGELVTTQVRRWRAHGLMAIAVGAFSWWKLWNALQASPIWGCRPKRLIMFDTADDQSALTLGSNSLLACLEIRSFFDLILQTAPGSFPQLWKLNFVEGPERSRKRLELDFNAQLDALICTLDSSQSASSDSAAAQAAEDDASMNESSSCSEVVDSSSKQQVSFLEPGEASEVQEISSSNSNAPLLEHKSSMESFLQSMSAEAMLQLQQSALTTKSISYDDIDDMGGDTQVTADDIDAILASTTDMSNESVDINDSFAINLESNFASSMESAQGQSTIDMEVGDEVEEDIASSQVVESEIFDNAVQQVKEADAVSPELEASLARVDASSTIESLKTSATGYNPEVSVERRVGAQRRTSLVASKKSQAALEIVKGLVSTGEWNSAKIFNVERIYGLEAQTALLLITQNNVHLVNGFRCKSSTTSKAGSQSQHSGSSMNNSDKSIEFVGSSAATAAVDAANAAQWKTNSRSRVTPEKASSFIATTRLLGAAGQHITDECKWATDIWEDLLCSDHGYTRMALKDVYTIFKRRHQLKYCAIELGDIHGLSMLFAFASVREFNEGLELLLESDLPSSLFSRVISMKQFEMFRGGLSSMFNKLMAQFLSTTTKMWQHGEISNFEYLIHLNSAAGRSFHDLTQYPVFPWVIADYKSETLDLNDPKTYRNLKLPMGAMGHKRTKQYRDRFKTMDEFKRSGIEGTPPPFHYGTHYSCAGYVLNYLIRLQPYSNMAIMLQGGQMDKADRLFSSIEQCWTSASHDNLQDVRELIPEFYCMPEFLTNSNHFGLGTTQKGDKVDDVVLPPWAKGSPHEFVRINREALESKHVSEHLNEWIDLIFGYKQRGPAAEEAMNVFIHLTYDDAVDIDAITDPVLRSATISQINNFGQTPARLFTKEHPKKIVPEILKSSGEAITVDAHAVGWHEHIAPSLSVIGAPGLIKLNKVSNTLSSHSLGTAGAFDKTTAVGDVRVPHKDRMITVPPQCLLVPPHFKRYARIGGVAGSISFHPTTNQPGARLFDQEKDMLLFEGLHEAEITCVAFSNKGNVMITGSKDSSLKLWNIEKISSGKLEELLTFIGHAGSLLCVDICSEYHIAVSGSTDYSVYCWDYLSGKLLRPLQGHESPVISISISSMSGYISTLTANDLRVFSINGDLLAHACYSGGMVGDTSISTGNVVMAVSCADWQDGIAAITGHGSGQVLLWRMKRDVEVTQDSMSMSSDFSLLGEGAGDELMQAKLGLLSLADPGSPSASASAMSSPSGDFALSPSSASLSTPRDRTATTDSYLDLLSSAPSIAVSKLKRRLVPFMLAKTHRAQISVLRLCSHISHANSRRDFIDKSFDNSTQSELYIGDMDGYVSRWNAAQLAQLSGGELQALIGSSAGLLAINTARKGSLSYNRSRADTKEVNKQPTNSISNITRSATMLLSSGRASISSARDIAPSPISEYSESEPGTPLSPVLASQGNDM